MSAVLSSLVLVAQAALAGQEPPENGESWALLQGLYARRRIDIRVPSGPCERAAERLAEAVGALGEFELSLDPALRDRDAVRMLVGVPLDPALEPLARACGVEAIEGGFRVLGRHYTNAGDAVVAVFRDPACAGRPLCLVLGNDLEQLSVYLDGIPRLSRPHLWVYADGELAVECPLAPGGRPRAEEACDYLARREEYFSAGNALDFEGLVVHVRSEPARQQWRAYGLALAGVQKRVLGWLGVEEPPTAEVFLYEHLEDMERCLGESVLSVTNRLRPRVHALLAPGMPDDGGAGLARALARAIAGAPAEAWLEDGLAVAASGRWWQRPLDEWIAHLAAGKLLPGPDELFAADAPECWSEHVLAPVRGFLFQCSVVGAGSDPRRVRALWKGAEIEPKKMAALYQRGVLEVMQAARPERGARGARTAVAPFRHGIALVDAEHAGYSSRAVDEALAEARALEPGPDAVSLTVFGTSQDPLKPVCGRFRSSTHGSASDLALASACAAARVQDLRVLLSLEVLAQPNGAWADVISWTGPDDERLFWERYERVALHYALLSELLRVELFSLGSNIRECTRTEIKGDVRDPELLAARRAAWKLLIGHLRPAFGGGLVYSARFTAEAQEAGLFEWLDYIGLLSFPRVGAGVTPDGSPDEAALRRAVRFELQQALELAVRWNKPLLLVQLGFPARADSWPRPMLPRGALDLEAQRRFYEALADVLAGKLENEAALRGFFLWNWPLEARLAGPEDAGFSLRGKPAESALRRLFAR